MTVEELIEKLKEMPPTAMVFMCGGDEDGPDVEDNPPFYDEGVERIKYEHGRVELRD
jgi:hypothetical protein